MLAGIVAWVGASGCGEDPYPYVSHPDADLRPDAVPVDAAPPPGGDGFVWLVGTVEEGVGGRDVIQPFYPEYDEAYYQRGFEDTAWDFRFRRMDGQLFYEAAFRGIVEDVASDSWSGADDVDVSTAPCRESPGGLFDFDGAGAVHYKCPAGAISPIYRAGTMIHAGVEDIAGVLDDGRVIVSEKAAYVVLSTDGQVVTSYTTTAATTPSPSATTVVGNDAWLLYRGATAVIVHYDGAAGTFTEVGDVAVTETDLGSFLVHPAGRLFLNADDPDGTEPDDRIIVSYAFDGSGRTVEWIEADHTTVRLHGNYNLFYQHRP